jgi:hypothetical protein
MALIQGQVIDPQGHPLAEVPVYFISSPMPVPDVALLTDAQGQFTLSVPVRGHYTLGTRAEDGSAAQTDVEVSGTEPVAVTIQVTTLGGTAK